jgi:hypothetical protein
MTTVHEWNAEAVQTADRLKDEVFEAHRGAVLVRPGVAAVFSNAGFREREQRELAEVRRQLKLAGFRELGWGLEGEGYSWAMLVEVPSFKTAAGRDMMLARLTDIVWDAWRTQCTRPDDIGFERCQRAIAEVALGRVSA